MEFMDDIEDEIHELSCEEKSLNFIFIELMKLKNEERKLKPNERDFNHQLNVLVIISEGSTTLLDASKSMKQKLSASGFDVKLTSTSETGSISNNFDFVLDLRSFDSLRSKLEETFHYLSSSGQLLLIVKNTDIPHLSFDNGWFQDNFTISDIPATGNRSLVKLNKKSILCNTKSVPYWERNEILIKNELKLIDSVTINLSKFERESGEFSSLTHRAAVDCLLKNGICIFPGLFDRKSVLDWGESAKTDLENIIKKLKESKGIDLLNPYIEGKSDENENNKNKKRDKKIFENYFELSMREALRCDLRNCKNITAKTQQTHKELSKYNEIYLNSSAITEEIKPFVKDLITLDDVYNSGIKPKDNFRFHPSILPIIYDAMNPPAHIDGLEQGNWGLWNFEGPGPDAGPALKIGQPGVVLSLPGCTDQTIHADTPHTHVFTHMPPHYLNLFIPAIEREKESNSEFLVGQTAFVVGSHRLVESTGIMARENGQNVLDKLLIRPQLEAGDAILFDCRILHFGLANCTNEKLLDNKSRNGEIWRPMVYINYHQPWFHDPKNWNEKEKLFE